MTPTTDDLIFRLMRMPDKLSSARMALLDAELARRDAAELLKNREARFLCGLDSPIDGKNAEQRAAQVRELTMGERAVLLVADQRADQAKLDLQRELDEFAALRAVAALMGPRAE